MNLVEKIDMSRSSSESEKGKALRLLAALTESERLEVMNRHRKYYLGAHLSQQEQEFLTYERRKNPAQLDLDFLILAIWDYHATLKKSGRSAELISTIRDQSRRSRIEKLRKDTFIVRLRGIFAEITQLRETEKLSWPQVAVYLRRSHRKYFGGKPINPDYLRRAYNKLIAEREDRAQERQKLIDRKKMI